MKKIPLNMILLAGILFLSGCASNEPRQQVLRNAEEYDVKTYQDRNADSSPAAHRLSVGAPQENAGAESQNQAKDNPSTNKQPPTMQIDTSKKYSAVLETSEGNIVIDLDVKRTPITSNNFVTLVKGKFYEGTIFHRVIKDFMIQGGDPQGTGSGGPGYKFDDENLEGKYSRGMVAMANSGPNTNGSQFFIMHQDYDLPNNYVIFGHVASGMDAVDKIAEAEVMAGAGGESSTPVSPVKVESVEIIEK